MGARGQRFAAEVSRFLAVGLAATIVAILIFNFLVHGYNTADWAPLNDQPELAYLIANGIGMLISFGGTKQWAFRDRSSRHPDGGIIAYTVINVATMAFPIACLWTTRNVMGLDDPISDNLSANVVGLLLANATRFVLYRRFVFPRVERPQKPTVQSSVHE